MNLFVASIGHTAAGKTSLLTHLASSLNIEYISEAEIKRKLVANNYNTLDSLDEQLRDKAYKIAIQKSVQLLNINSIILDASFHKLYRRLWIYDELIEQKKTTTLVWLNIYCNNLEKINARITYRANQKIKIASNQADSMLIYNHIIKTFDPVLAVDFPKNITNIIVNINTDSNTLTCNSIDISEDKIPDLYFKLLNEIENYLLKMRDLRNEIL